jgi:hypothetical protein
MAFCLRRRKDDNFVNSVVSCTETHLDHLWILPNNPYFVLKYNAQKDVRRSLTVWSRLSFTQIRVRVQKLGLHEPMVRAPDSVGAVQTKWNEAQNMLGSKIVSHSVAGWRLCKCEIYGQSHTLFRLVIRLPWRKRSSFLTEKVVQQKRLRN